MSNAYYQLPNGRVANIDGDCDFPPVNMALKDPNGLVAIGGELSLNRLLKAYTSGIFPWFNEGDPILWWSPNPRMVLFPDEFKISKSLTKTIKTSAFEIRFNTDFRAVISACSSSSRHGQPGTWITKDIIDAYCNLENKGYAISAECWLDNNLVGGCYGVKIGNMFYGESMFHQITDASKVAFVMLVQKLKNESVGMIDCQMKTDHLSRFGAREISRDDFTHALTRLVNL